MKKFILFCALALNACSTDPPPAPSTLESTFSITANGVPYQWNGSLLTNTVVGSKIEGGFNNPCSQTNFRIFTLRAKGVNGECYIYLIPSGQDLVPGTYESSYIVGNCAAQLVELNLPQQTITAFPDPRMGHTFTTIITKVSNGFATGSFIGTLKNFNGIIINVTGQFGNVKVIQ